MQSAVAKRKTGLPIAYITGHKEFFGYDFAVTLAVLIPKPDTELLVELAIATVKDRLAAHPNAVPTVCDMCTGSGCVGIALLRTLVDSGSFAEGNLPPLTLADVNAGALSVARENVMRLLTPPQRQSVHLVRTDLFGQVPHIFDIITANPPYVPSAEALALLADGRGEPLLALDGDATGTGDGAASTDGLAVIRRLVPQAHAHLADGGTLLMETGEYNAEDAAELCERAGFRSVRIKCDLGGQPRVVCGQKRAE